VGTRASPEDVEKRKILPLMGIEGDITNENYPSTNKPTDTEWFGAGVVRNKGNNSPCCPPSPMNIIIVTESGIQNWWGGGGVVMMAKLLLRLFDCRGNRFFSPL
jgi:hypothetical protein